jgi:hypothetical protein
VLGVARALLKPSLRAYTLIEIPPVYLMPGKTEGAIKTLKDL